MTYLSPRRGLRTAAKAVVATHFPVCAAWQRGAKMTPEGGFAVRAGGRAKFFLDAEELVVLRNAVGARTRAGLDLAGSGGDRQVSDKRVFGFAGTMRNDRVVAGLASEFDGING